jgi:thiamine biosynthesis lipoprotein
MKIDLGSLAKGYAIAKARALLVKQGVKSALISTGSSVTVIGTNGGKPWRIGIKSPEKPDDIIGVVSLKPGQALSTSGDYEKFFEVKGKRYHHIIDPRTAMPAGGTKSVTIISDDATLSDALSTAVFVMGPTRGLRFLRRLDKVYGVIVDKNGSVLTTPGLILER